MVFIKYGIIILWTKVVSALEGLNMYLLRALKCFFMFYHKWTTLHLWPIPGIVIKAIVRICLNCIIICL